MHQRSTHGDIGSPIFNPIPVACARLGVGRSTLYKLITAGELATVKIGGRSVIPEQSMSDFERRVIASGKMEVAR